MVSGNPTPFEWPCKKRTAHGRHFDLDAAEMCPGVKAHPKTMIGRVPNRFVISLPDSQP